MPSRQRTLLKVIILGDNGVGKTYLMNQSLIRLHCRRAVAAPLLLPFS
ncbi:Ras-related protein RABG3f [Linum perenne]